jgi:hypothetical protein
MNPYQHGEAFCHMTYASKDGGETEVIWNSRDGVTPFIICSRNGTEMKHVNWRQDRRDPSYVPKAGDRIFIDARRDLLLDRAKSYVDRCWEDPTYPLKDGPFESKEEAIESFLRNWTNPGEPTLVSVKDDGTFEVV